MELIRSYELLPFRYFDDLPYKTNIPLWLRACKYCGDTEDHCAPPEVEKDPKGGMCYTCYLKLIKYGPSHLMQNKSPKKHINEEHLR